MESFVMLFQLQTLSITVGRSDVTLSSCTRSLAKPPSKSVPISSALTTSVLGCSAATSSGVRPCDRLKTDAFRSKISKRTASADLALMAQESADPLSPSSSTPRSPNLDGFCFAQSATTCNPFVQPLSEQATAWSKVFPCLGSFSSAPWFSVALSPCSFRPLTAPSSHEDEDDVARRLPCTMGLAISTEGATNLCLPAAHASCLFSSKRSPTELPKLVLSRRCNSNRST
mmetsp:Transcript_57584/g.106411  ORF Transcript_57584/g.106411 Transcript_57584/m.106411 type:complete len:229 (-) Transcript_57584:201-887(-)